MNARHASVIFGLKEVINIAPLSLFVSSFIPIITILTIQAPYAAIGARIRSYACH